MDAVGNMMRRLFCERPVGRRQLLRGLGLAGLRQSLPFAGYAAEGNYDAMLLSCIDPRIVTPVYKYMDSQGLSGKYSQFCIAGAAIAVVADKFKAWRPAFRDNTATSVQLHHIDGSSRSIIATAVPQRSLMARKTSPRQRPRPRPIKRCWPSSARWSRNAIPNSLS